MVRYFAPLAAERTTRGREWVGEYVLRGTAWSGPDEGRVAGGEARELWVQGHGNGVTGRAPACRLRAVSDLGTDVGSGYVPNSRSAVPAEVTVNQ